MHKKDFSKNYDHQTVSIYHLLSIKNQRGIEYGCGVQESSLRSK